MADSYPCGWSRWLFMGLVVLGDIALDGELYCIVHLGGQHLVLAVQLGQRRADRLVLGAVLLRAFVHCVQADAVSGEQPQGQLAADLCTGGLVQGLGGLAGLLIGMRNVQRTAVTGVRPKGPDHTGRRQRDTACVVDLSPGGGDRAIQQLLGRRILAEHRPVLIWILYRLWITTADAASTSATDAMIAQPALAQRQPRRGEGRRSWKPRRGWPEDGFSCCIDRILSPLKPRKRSLSLLCEPCDKTEKACAAARFFMDVHFAKFAASVRVNAPWCSRSVQRRTADSRRSSTLASFSRT